MPNLKDYKKIIGKEIIDEIHSKAEKLSGKHILYINSTYRGGGVAELLNSAIVLFNAVGVNVGWRILHGSPDFFSVTKKFHNALQGDKINLSPKKKKIYYETNRRFSSFTHIDHDLVVVHDPQPLPLIDFYKKTQPWILRFHIDLSNPNPVIWNYLKPFVEKYDHVVFSHERYRKDLKIPQTIIYPAIDPLSIKNKPVSDKAVNAFLAKYGVYRDKPIISQVSRFDKWKDPMGVVNVFEKVKKQTDCQLVLLGDFAADDPEGQFVFAKLQKIIEKSRYKKDITLIVMENSFLVNCLQRASSVVVQKSLREGFGLTVSEALYKGTPVVASNVGGIPLQVIDNVNGFLHEPTDAEGFSQSIIKLLKDENLRKAFGEKGKTHVKNNFLITRLMISWMNLFEQYLVAK